MKSHFLAFSMVLILFVVSSTSGQSLEEEIEKADQQTSLSLPEPPVGMSITKEPLIIQGKLLGSQVALTQAEALSKAFIKVEFTDRSSEESRKAACKGYLNGLIASLKQAGLNYVPGNLPDLEKADLKKPLDLELEFTNESGEKIHVWKRIFFTTKGYDITVIAADKDDLQFLTDWAKKVRPVTTK